MLKGLASDFTGSADICHVVKDFTSCLAAAYLLPNESIVFALQSSKGEFTFTNEALLKIVGESATTTRKLVTRYDYKNHIVSHVRFETAGRVDRDCEIKFVIGSEHVSIDIAKDEELQVCDFYKVLELLSRQQKQNERQWEFSRVALDKASDALRLSESSGQTLTKQADEALARIQEAHTRTHPRCYREVIQNAFNSIRMSQKILEQ
ncbi:Bacterial ph-like domain, partial [Globisporangium splendens]